MNYIAYENTYFCSNYAQIQEYKKTILIKKSTFFFHDFIRFRFHSYEFFFSLYD